MRMRQKFFVLAGITGLIMAIVSCIGYYTAYTNLETSVESELNENMKKEAASVDGWLREKSSYAVGAARLMATMDGASTVPEQQAVLRMVTGDDDIVGMVNANETGAFFSGKKDNTGKVNPQERGWYKQAKGASGLTFTDAYKDSTNGELVVTAAVPYKGANGAFRGAICEDIRLGALEKIVEGIDYKDQGKGFLLDPKGMIIASATEGESMTQVKDNAHLADHFDQMVQSKKGYFVSGDDVVAYATVPTTGWITGIIVPESEVFAPVRHLRVLYGILTIVGIALVVFACLRFSAAITGHLEEVRAHADELAGGNLSQDDLIVDTGDELGDLATSFNEMTANLRKLITKIASTSEQVAAASEELTANAQQSAEASNNVAETVASVSGDMDHQVKNVQSAKGHVDHVYEDIANVTDKANRIAQASAQTADAAQEGAGLMDQALAQMEQIERSVKESAEVIGTLGENSQQIGEIVDTISEIADQTNLLALNAAIEAARAGEHGRGFSVVADEVRKLAEASQASAEEIHTRIAAIQKDTENAVTSMKSGSAQVADGTTAIRNVSTHFKDILAQVSEMRAQMDEIQGSVHALEDGAKSIVQSMDDIDEISGSTSEHTQTISAATEEQSASNEEIASASNSLAKMASDLQEATSHFKLS